MELFLSHSLETDEDVVSKKNLGPRRKRMKRKSRLEAAKHWVKTYTGKHIIKGYRNWFGVDLLCAIQELKMLGIKLDEQYICRVLEGREQQIIAKQKKREKAEELEDLCGSDDDFYFIAGYTSWGFPYGITWREARAQNLVEDHGF